MDKILKFHIMAKRKYNYYQVSDDFGTETYENYREAFAEYNRADGDATLYGFSEDGPEIIMSKCG